MRCRTLRTLAGGATIGLALLACSESIGEFSTASGGGKGPTASAGSSGSGGSIPPPLDGDGGVPDELRPERSCGLRDGGGDGGGDAAQEGGAPAPRDPSEDCSPPPPSACGGPRSIVRFYNGVCVAGQCRWDQAQTACEGGCFRGLDGVDRCNTD